MTNIQLLAILGLTNNGYLFAPTADELKCARAHPHEFTVSGNLICRRGFVIPTYADPRPARRVVLDDFDYESAIIARQGSPE